MATKAVSKKVPVKAAVKSSAKKTAAKKSVPAKKSASQSSAKKAPAKRVPSKKTSGTHAAPKKTSTTDKYTDPALRERIKAKVIREDKGGRAGQWSARKAQMVAHEYEAEGGKYRGGRDDKQKSLTAWGDEHWTTQDGKPARRADGMHRYLPEKAWEQLSVAEKRSTERKKHLGDVKGEQFVSNTSAAVKARRRAEKKTAKR